MFDWLRHLFPYTDFHELNADWLLQAVKEASDKAEEAASEVDTWDDRITAAEANAELAVRTANTAQSAVQGAVNTANAAQTAAAAATSTANDAKEIAQTALSVANAARTQAGNAQTTASEAVTAANTAAQSAQTSATAANTAAQAAQAAQAQVANKAEVYHFMVTRPYLAHQGAHVLDQSEWNIPLQDLVWYLIDKKQIPALTIRDETGTQGVYINYRQVFPNIEIQEQEHMRLAWIDEPLDTVKTIRYTTLDIVEATASEPEKATYSEFTISAT